MVNLYSWSKRGLCLNIEMANEEGLYYRYRQRFNQLIDSGEQDSQEAAQVFYYLNRTGYNGLCRFNRRGGFNVPFGRYARIAYTRDFTPYRAALADWTFPWGAFADSPPRPDAFLYADPPYDVEFTSCTPGGFTWAD